MPMGLEKTLPSSFYRSPRIFRREKERIFFREWLCAGRQEQIPSPGDYLVLDVAGESLLVVRTRGGELRAHYNVCRHRGARLCPAPLAGAGAEAAALGGSGGPPVASVGAAVGSGGPPAGPTGRLGGSIRCPYHAWTYALDGRLLGTPHLERESLAKEEFGLHPAGLDTWGGFIFLNLSPAEAQSRGRTMAQQLGEAPEKLARYPLRDLRAARRIVYDVAANWKVILENYNECYHCGPVHPELCEVVPAFKKGGGSGLDWENGVPHREGATTFTFTGTTSRAPFPGLSEAEKTRHNGQLVYPNFMLSLSADHAAAFTLWPEGPRRTRIVCDFLFHPLEMARASFDPKDAVEFWDLINRQDWAICEEVQRGLRSRVHRFGYYAPMEDLSLDIRRYISDRLGPVPNARRAGRSSRLTARTTT